MVRLGESVRLTHGRELGAYRVLTSCLPSLPDPRTLPELLAQLELAAHCWEHAKTDPDGQALAARARDFADSYR